MICYTQMPYHHRSNDVYEKSVTKRLHLQYFSAPEGPPVPKFTSLGSDVWQGLLYQAATFRPVLQTPLVLRDTCWESSSIPLTVWPTHTHTHTQQ